MSVPIFEVSTAQVNDFCQTGRLVGCSDPLYGDWIVVSFGTRFGRPLHYVHGRIYETLQDADEQCKFMELVSNQPTFDGQLCYEYEIWHVVYDDEVSAALEALRQLRAAGDEIVPPCDYVADHDGECTLIMHWVPALGSHVAVLVNRFGVSLPTDWQCLQPRTLADCAQYDWLSSDEFVQDFTSADYAQVIKAYEDSILCVR